MTTETKSTETTEATTSPGTPGGVAVDQAAGPAGAVLPAAAPALPAVDSPGEIELFLRAIRDGLDELRGLLAALRADVDEIGGTVTGHAGVIDAQSRSMDAMQEAIGILGARLPQPNVRAEPVRTLPPGASLPGGLVLPPVRPAPSLPPGVLPPLRPAPSAGEIITSPASGPGQPGQLSALAGLSLAVPIDRDTPAGTHVIPPSPETGGVELVINVKRPGEGLGGIAAPRNPKAAFRRQQR
jgi:hypothetical protein